MLPAPMKTTLKSSPPATWVVLSIGTSLDGSMDGRREDIPDPRRSEARRSESDMMGEHSVELYTRVCGVDQYKPGDLI